MVPRAGAHQLGQEAFKTILAEDVDWKPFPAFPPSVRLAVVVGQPSEPAPTQSGSKRPPARSSCLTSTQRIESIP